MNESPMRFNRWIIPAIIAAVICTLAYAALSGSSNKELTAYFQKTVSLYPGSSVRVLGVNVGAIDSVTPQGTRVKVTLHYDSSVKLPANVKAVIIAPSVVGDRFVQLTPAYTTGQTLQDNATLQLDHTSDPLELDQIYANIDQLVAALGPNGANKHGALNDLLQQTAKNFNGEGGRFNQTLSDLGRFTKTLDDNKTQFFGSATKLEGFVHSLATNDATVRRFAGDLANVSSLLAGERGDLGTSLTHLASAMGQVASFVRDNKAQLGTTIGDLNNVLGVAVHERAALAEALKDAPLALNNLYLVYDPDIGGLNANAHLDQLLANGLSDPTNFLCALVSANDPSGSLCKTLAGLKLPRAALGGATPRTDPSFGGLVPVTR